MSSATLVYALLDPRDGRLRYIGKTTEPRRRFLFHYRADTRGHCKKWEALLLRLGLRPIPVPIEWVEDAHWGAEREKEWIRRARAVGCSLVNATDGGEGTFGFVPTADTRAKMSAAKLGKTSWNKGMKTPDEVRVKLSSAAMGRIPWNKGLWGPANPLYGRRRPEEVIAKCSEGQRRRWARYRQENEL